MKIIAITMVKNEMDVIESFVRHTLTFADELIVCEHRSSDATREILESLRAEGLPMEIETEYRAAHVQEDVMSRLLLVAADRGADLIVPLDADEFLLPRAPGDTRAVLETLSTERVYHVQLRLCAPTGGTEETFLLARPLCTQRDFDTGSKCIVGGDLARRIRPCITEGNHTIFVYENGQRCTISEDPCGLYLAHFFWRSREQWQSKALVTWVNIASQFSVDVFPAGGYLDYAEQVCNGRGKTLEDVIPDAVPYDLTGFMRPQTLRYSGAANIDVLRNLAAAATELAENCAVLRAEQQKPRVTSIVPYLGEETAFRTSFASVRAEVFPRQQILVPVLAGDVPDALASELDALAQTGKLQVIHQDTQSSNGGGTLRHACRAGDGRLRRMGAARRTGSAREASRHGHEPHPEPRAVRAPHFHAARRRTPEGLAVRGLRSDLVPEHHAHAAHGILSDAPHARCGAVRRHERRLDAALAA